ncbi:MAG: hypothetical protein AAF431_07055 [Pseudomonadota bacterium]
MSNIQYHGDGRTTQSCIDAVQRILQFGGYISLARLLTCKNRHAFFLTIDEYQNIIIQAGFASGYGGEAPKGLARVIQLIRFHGVKLEEIDVPQKVFRRIDCCKLRDKDLKQIEETPFKRPVSLYDYVLEVGELADTDLMSYYKCAIP